ncbi:MAG: site-specific DNA-methyltransferase, partial [Gemmatimonadetes bacterium]|nr:site-specific DNA-methyltransferase [Gemmatimonadota bacterium]
MPGKRDRKTGSYTHPEASALLRPEVGAQPQFKKKRPPVSYRYDSSLSPALEWDGQNPAREQAEQHIRGILDAFAAGRGRLRPLIAELRDAGQDRLANELEGLIEGDLATGEKAAVALESLSTPFLNWSGKAERLSFEVPTLPLFVHERLSTKAILQTLKGHKRDRQLDLFDLFGERDMALHEKLLKAYEHANGWTNRLILGDSLVVMSSLLHYESMAGQVQMIYMDPPYGVKFGSNFQPFVRKRDVKHNDDEDMTREPEMVKAYRDTWELGLHSYLTYLRDRLLLCRELLAPSGSIFVQISDENLHHVREVMDEVFGGENFVVLILVKKTGGQKGGFIQPVNDYLVWYARDKVLAQGSFVRLFESMSLPDLIAEGFNIVEFPNGDEARLADVKGPNGDSRDYEHFPELFVQEHPDCKLFASNPLTSGGFRKNQSVKFEFKGRSFDPGIARGNCWKHTAVTEDGRSSGMDRLAHANRLFVGKNQLRFKRYSTDFPFKTISNWWDSFGGASNPLYVVQTNEQIVRRCLLMTTKPGDLILDPTYGSGTSAYV